MAINDEPIAHTADGRPLFDNTPTVVCVLAAFNGKLIVVRRGNQPGKGLIGLPGGYHMRGETWQEAGVREVFEETGYLVNPELMNMMRMDTDEYGNNLVIARGWSSPIPPTDDFRLPDEVQEVLLLSAYDLGRFSREDWAFPRHYMAANLFTF